MEFDKNIKEIEKKIHYTFKDKGLLMQAFTRSSFCNEHKGIPGEEYISNEVLEFFGDSVLSTAIISILLEEKTKRYRYGIYTKLCVSLSHSEKALQTKLRHASREIALVAEL